MVDYVFEKMKILSNTCSEIREHIAKTENKKSIYYQQLYKKEKYKLYKYNMPEKLYYEMSFAIYCVRINKYEYNNIFKQLTYKDTDKQKQLKAYLNSTEEFE